MRILFLSPGLFDKGGIARYGRYQVRALRDAYGPEAVAALSLLGPAEGDLEEPLRVSWRGGPRATVGSRVRMVAAAAAWAFRHRPGVVLTAHVHLGPLGRVLARATGARFVQTVYGIEIWSGLSRARAEALGAADGVISDCHNTAEVALRLGLVERKPFVVWDCVDLERFRPGDPDEEVLSRYGAARGSRFRVLFLGRIAADARYKGTERLLRLLARLPHDRFEAVFAGRGNDVPFLEARAVELRVSDRVRFTGAVHEDHLAHVYRSADAFYLTSEAGPEMGEGLPLTPIEAMACGVPVLVGDRDGSREILAGEGGWVGSPENLAGQAAYLLSLATDGARQESERRAARRRAEEAFGFEAFRDATSGFLLDVAGGL
jgi:phosphatidylinositol alpha-1,6-mannosyltransferase